MRNIVTVPAKSLREPSLKVREISERELSIIDDMVRLSREWEDAHPYELSAAMAAPQLGENVRIIIVRDDLDDKNVNTFTALINPEIIRTEGRDVTDFEGCLSVPVIYGKVTRPEKVKIKATLVDGSEARIKASGFLARTIMHEIDHLDGKLFIDHIRGQSDAFYKMNDKGDLVPVENYESEIANNKTLWGEDA